MSARHSLASVSQGFGGTGLPRFEVAEVSLVDDGLRLLEPPIECAKRISVVSRVSWWWSVDGVSLRPSCRVWKRATWADSISPTPRSPNFGLEPRPARRLLASCEFRFADVPTRQRIGWSSSRLGAGPSSSNGFFVCATRPTSWRRTRLVQRQKPSGSVADRHVWTRSFRDGVPLSREAQCFRCLESRGERI